MFYYRVRFDLVFGNSQLIQDILQFRTWVWHLGQGFPVPVPEEEEEEKTKEEEGALGTGFTYYGV